jgi:hypothetical protein
MHTAGPGQQQEKQEDAALLDAGIDRLVALAAARLGLATIGRRLQVTRSVRRSTRLPPLDVTDVSSSKYDAEAVKNDRYPLSREAILDGDHYAT